MKRWGMGGGLIIMASIMMIQCREGANSELDIVGGQKAKRAEFFLSLLHSPLAELGEGDLPSCGASYLGGQWAITAAHCVQKRRQAHVSWAGNEGRFDQASSRVQGVVIHPEFDPYSQANDVALLFLADDLSQVPQVKPIELGGDVQALQKVWVHGRGSQTSVGTVNEYVTMHRAELVVQEDNLCRRSLFGAFFADYMFCAIGDWEKGGVDTCLGDSGGPVVSGSGDPALVGIISWGFGCAQPQTPGAYTRVVAVASWVRETMKRYENRSLDFATELQAHCPLPEAEVSQSQALSDDARLTASHRVDFAQAVPLKQKVEGLKPIQFNCEGYEYLGERYELEAGLTEEDALVIRLKNHQSLGLVWKDFFWTQFVYTSPTHQFRFIEDAYLGWEFPRVIQHTGQGSRSYSRDDEARSEALAQVFSEGDYELAIAHGYGEKVLEASLAFRGESLFRGRFVMDPPEESKAYSLPPLIQVQEADPKKVRLRIVPPVYVGHLFTWRLVCTEPFSIQVGHGPWAKALKGGDDGERTFEHGRIYNQDPGGHVPPGEGLSLTLLPFEGQVFERLTCSLNGTESVQVF